MRSTLSLSRSERRFERTLTVRSPTSDIKYRYFRYSSFLFLSSLKSHEKRVSSERKQKRKKNCSLEESSSSHERNTFSFRVSCLSIFTFFLSQDKNNEDSSLVTLLTSLRSQENRKRKSYKKVWRCCSLFFSLTEELNKTRNPLESCNFRVQTRVSISCFLSIRWCTFNCVLLAKEISFLLKDVRSWVTLLLWYLKLQILTWKIIGVFMSVFSDLTKSRKALSSEIKSIVCKELASFKTSRGQRWYSDIVSGSKLVSKIRCVILVSYDFAWDCEWNMIVFSEL